ncbi:MAG TPA: DUF5683 domain-containing protein [Chitinophagaceae bacterium]|nr:hypothetical protein [Chitinophagaceae bacterium]MCB9056570.1 hypothetical protein [Chitinophagales bacterium]HPG10583.1 DUF5683 domain-containing protein [Chitinophagaceae bacterium]HRX92892.1 DUF5683 domain-containing protein [Chitinophagaceae bacterium]
MKFAVSFLLYILFVAPTWLLAQEEEVLQPVKDTVPKIEKTVVTKATGNRYDSALKAHSPKKAAIRSAILPGLGQIYNKKYWKLPIVYGALGTCGVVFAYNLKNYKETRFAYRVKYNMSLPGATAADSALFNDIEPHLKPLSSESLKYYRDGFRRDIDYSVLVFILLWGLNVVDATVDAHLKTFDVSPDLSLQIKPGYSDMARTNGLSLVLKIGR